MSPRPASASTTDQWLQERLTTPEQLELHLEALVGRDPRLAPVRVRAGEVRLRTAPRGFAGLARVVCGQQLSTASAAAIWGRLAEVPGATDAGRFLGIDETVLRAAGLSRGKVESLRAVARAVTDGVLDFPALERLPAEAAIAQLTLIRGIGPWTAEIYLLFCVGHPDVFPAGDLALKKAVADGLGLAAPPGTGELAGIAAGWSPHRGAAALLFWRFFHVLRGREGVAA